MAELVIYSSTGEAQCVNDSVCSVFSANAVFAPALHYYQYLLSRLIQFSN